MPKVTDIKQQKRSEGRFSVYLDGNYAFALSDLELSLSQLRVGWELSEAEVEGYKEAGEEGKAYNRAIKYLGYRPRSVWEVEVYLASKGFEPEIVKGAVGQLKGVGLLDDVEFARSWIASRQAVRPRSRRMIEQELMAKRVEKEAILVAIGEFAIESELDSLTQLAQKKAQLSQYRDPQKLMAYLARQGYSYDQIKKALERLEA